MERRGRGGVGRDGLRDLGVVESYGEGGGGGGCCWRREPSLGVRRANLALVVLQAGDSRGPFCAH